MTVLGIKFVVVKKYKLVKVEKNIKENGKTIDAELARKH